MVIGRGRFSFRLYFFVQRQTPKKKLKKEEIIISGPPPPLFIHFVLPVSQLRPETVEICEKESQSWL
jgi:hypothetical protein